MGSLVSVVFVHGFMSGAGTWEAFDAVLAGDAEFADGIEVDKFAYDTRPFQLHPLRRIPALSDVAESLRVKLVDEIPAGRSVVLVTHSMGGLVVQQYLADRLRAGTTEELASIAGIVMFACPNEGSLLLYSARRWASLVPMLRNRQERALRPINRQIIANRKEVLNRIVHAEDPAMRIPMWLFAGESDGVVSPQSARSVFPDRFVGALPGDHFSIIRPDSARHRSYLTLKNRVAYAITDHQRRNPDGKLQRPPPHAGVTDTLRPDLDTFVGRDSEIQQILAAADKTRVIAVDGMAGVGKTALVTRVAHLLADRFPDGRYFLDLNAHTPGQAPAEPTGLLARLLANLGVAAGAIPDSLDARRDLWLDRLRDRRVLLVLDGALDSAQVEPLLPSGTGCLTLITSRRRSSALGAAVTVSVDQLDPDAAVGLFSTVAGRTPTEDDLAAVKEIVRLCGYLPLAITLLARRLAQHTTWTIPTLATDFAATENRLTHIDLDAGLRAAKATFTLSYRDLPIERQQLFRRLVLHPGPDLEAGAVAALVEIPAETARHELDALYTDHLLDEIAPGRYRLHDLLREYAHSLAEEDPIEDRTAAIDRLLDHYHTVGTDPDGSTLDWMRTERENLLACLDYVAIHHQPARLIALTRMLTDLLYADGPWPLAIELHRRTATIAHEIGDRSGEADTRYDLGRIRYMIDEYRAAEELYRQALSIYREVGSRTGEANVLRDLGRIRYMTDEYSAAEELYQQALTIYRDIDGRSGEADILYDLGRIRYMADEHPSAEELYQQALSIYCDIGHRIGEANTRYHLGRIRYSLNEYPAAEKLYQQALSIYREVGNRTGEADVLYDLGRISYMIDEYPAAEKLCQQALSFYRNSGNRTGEADALQDLGRIRYMLGEYRAAEELHQQALGIYREVGGRSGEADALGSIGRIRYMGSDHRGAEELYRQALGIYREVGGRTGEASTLDSMGRIRYMSSDYPGAEEFQQQALTIYRDIGSRTGEADSLHQLGCIRYLAGEYPAAEELHQQALALYRDVGNRVGEANTLDSIGAIRYMVDDYPAAEELHQQALSIRRDIGNRTGEADTLHQLGTIRYVLEDYPAAEGLYREALAIYRDVGSRSGVADVLGSIGLIHYMNSDYPAAEELYQEALTINRDVGNRSGEADIRHQLGFVRYTTGNYRAAGELYQQALTIYRDIGRRIGEANVLQSLGDLRGATGAYQVAGEWYQQALTIHHDVGNPIGEANSLYGLAETRRASGNHAGAVELYQRALTIYRDIDNRPGVAKTLGKLVDTPNALKTLIDRREGLDNQLDSWLTQFRRE